MKKYRYHELGNRQNPRLRIGTLYEGRRNLCLRQGNIPPEELNGRISRHCFGWLRVKRLKPVNRKAPKKTEKTHFLPTTGKRPPFLILFCFLFFP